MKTLSIRWRRGLPVPFRSRLHLHEADMDVETSALHWADSSLAFGQVLPFLGMSRFEKNATKFGIVILNCKFLVGGADPLDQGCVLIRARVRRSTSVDVRSSPKARYSPK